MLKITAKGKINGVETVVTYLDGDVSPDTPEVLQAIYAVEPIGGTYWPEPFDPLNVARAMYDRMFDERPVVTADGDLPRLPFDPKVIYQCAIIHLNFSLIWCKGVKQ